MHDRGSHYLPIRRVLLILLVILVAALVDQFMLAPASSADTRACGYPLTLMSSPDVEWIQVQDGSDEISNSTVVLKGGSGSSDYSAKLGYWTCAQGSMTVTQSSLQLVGADYTLAIVTQWNGTTVALAQPVMTWPATDIARVGQPSVIANGVG